MMKVKHCLVEEKKHIRFNDWSAHDVSLIIKLNFFDLSIFFAFAFNADRNFEQKFVSHLEADDLFG